MNDNHPIPDFDKLTPGPWRWVFMESAGNYYLVGNDGEGPVTLSGPDCADGRLKEAAPALLKALTGGIGIINNADFATDLESIAALVDDHFPGYARALAARAQAIRTALAAVRGEVENTD
jgi:hypothetical protein